MKVIHFISLIIIGSVALLQPSLYEGWSTLVEEAKALSKFIVLSDLPVHREQINKNVAFFDPHNANELAVKMIEQLENKFYVYLGTKKAGAIKTN